MGDKIDIPVGELRRLYQEEGLSMEDCADEFGCSSTLIEFRLRRYDIPIRPPGSDPVDIPERELTELYVDEGLSIREIAERYDCHNSTISRRLREYDIPTSGTNHGNAVQIPKDELVELYVDEGNTTYELAERFDCDPTVIERRLRWYGVETRHTSAGDGEWQYKYGANWRKQTEESPRTSGVPV